MIHAARATGMAALYATGAPSRNAGYDIVLLAHVLSAMAGLGAIGIAGVSALALRRPGPPSESLRRYYRPGVNWAGRTIFLVPVFGFALIALSGGAYSFADGWVTAGLLLWASIAVVAEMTLWPTERKLQAAVSTWAPADDRALSGESSGLEGTAGVDTAIADVGSQCLLVAGMAALLAVALVVAAVIMVAKP